MMMFQYYLVYLLLLNSNVISWKIKKAHSSAHSLCLHPLSASKHLNSFQSRNTSTIVEEKSKREKELEAHRAAIVERMGLADTITQANKFKTGAELRADRKNVLRKERKQERAIFRLKEGREVNALPSKAKGARKQPLQNKFILGNRKDCPSAASIVELVRAAVPHIMAQDKLVMDDDDDDSHEDNKGDMEGWESILFNSKLVESLPNTEDPTEIQRVDYFALSLAGHFATMASYAPIDVSSSIMGDCWYDPSDFVLEKQFDIVKDALKWETRKVSKRSLRIMPIDALYPISYHDGDMLGVMVAALGAFIRRGLAPLAEEAEHLITTELKRQSKAFKFVRASRSDAISDTILLKLAMVLTHSVGMIDRALSRWEMLGHDEHDRLRQDLLGIQYDSDNDRDGISLTYDGQFIHARLVCETLLALRSDHHTCYTDPFLKDEKQLRKVPDLMLPLHPWLESWGKAVAGHPDLSTQAKASVLKQLVRGCSIKTSNSNNSGAAARRMGYLRALRGMSSVSNLDNMASKLDKPTRDGLKLPEVRKHLDLSDRDFATRLGQRTREVLWEEEKNGNGPGYHGAVAILPPER